MPTVATKGINLHYEVHGEGPRVLFFNGTGGDLRREPNIFQSPLAERFEILAHDQRGLGRSEKPDGPYTMADYAADAEALLDAVGWGACCVMGQSFGGMVAQEFAIRYPQRVQKLVLCATSSGGAGGSSYPVHALAMLDADERVKRYIALADTRCTEAWARTHRAEYTEPATTIVKGWDVGRGEPGRGKGIRLQMDARMAHDTYDRLPQIAPPTLVCAGLYDGVAPLSNAEALHDRIPNAVLETFEGGHNFLRQDPRAFVRIAEFLSDV